MDAGLFLHGGAQVFQLRGGKGAVSHGGDHLPQGLDTYVPGGIQAVRRGLLAAVGEDIALVIQFSQAAHQLRGRLITGKNEHAEGLSVRRMVLGHLTGFGIPVPEIAEEVSPDTSSTSVLVRTVIFSWFLAASAVAWAQVKSSPG